MSKLAILTTAFNHTTNHYFTKNWKLFCESLLELNLQNHLYICEILPDNGASIATLEDSNHFTIYNNSQLWHKECGINYLLNKIPDRYDYILVLDNDIVFENKNWYSNIIDALQSNIMVQPFSHIKYLEHNNLDIETIDTSMCYESLNTEIVDKGNPGIAVAYHKKYLDHMQGLYDECLVGGGDVLNIIPFFYLSHAISPKIFEMICSDSINRYIQYMIKANKYLQQTNTNHTHLPNTVQHLFHGYLKHRQYHYRYNIINNHLLTNIVVKNNYGFYNLTDTDTYTKLNTYFHTRQSLDCINQPIIITSSKYGCDNDKVLWLSPIEKIVFRNIKKISILLKNYHNLTDISIIANNLNIDTQPLLNNKEIKLTIDNPETLDILSPNSTQILTDNRKLGLLITEIEIFDPITDTMKSYPLSNVL